MELRAVRSSAVIVDEPVVEGYASEPWTRRNVTGFALSTTLAAALLGASFLGVSSELHLKDQVPFLDLGIAGLLVATAGGVGWLAAGIKAVRLRKSAVVALVRLRFGSVEAAGPAGLSDDFVATSRMTRYHRSTCSLVAGKDVSPAAPAEHSAAGRRPCGVCVA
jgi:hypothetical protein